MDYGIPLNQMHNFPQDPQPSHVIMNLEQELNKNSGNGNAGENAIIGTSGANHKLNCEMVDDKAKEVFADMFPNRRIPQRKKHWPLNINVRLPGSTDTIKIEVSSSIKVKNLKAQILKIVEKNAAGGDL